MQGGAELAGGEEGPPIGREADAGGAGPGAGVRWPAEGSG